MISLVAVDETNFGDCLELKRDSEKWVGNAAYVMGEAYVHREISVLYAICNNDEPVGLVILNDLPERGLYRFNSLFIADNHQRKGYGRAAVLAIIEKLRQERKHDKISIFVYETNEPAIKLYESCGFTTVSRASWDERFYVYNYFL